MAILALGGTALVAGYPLAADWLNVAIHLVPAKQRSLWFLKGLLVGYTALAIAAVLGLVALGPILVRARKERTQKPIVARLLLLCGSIVFGLLVLEASAAAWLAWTHRIPKLSTPLARNRVLKPEPVPSLPTGLLSRTSQELTILVIGESSARGEPYFPWLSIGQILAWQLEQVFPDRRVRVEMWAEPGVPLENQHLKLTKLDHRPDILLVCSGHNEFQSRFSWYRNVPHYDDRVAALLPQKLSNGMRAFSPLTRMILAEIDRQQVSIAPPFYETRHLVDFPVCTPDEYRWVRQMFERRLDAIAGFCESMHTIPIFVIPGSNDAGFEPDRSVLRHDTPPAERQAFAREFLAARKLEAQDPLRARASYEALLEQHPEFAETHFRLGRLCERAEEWQQARDFYLAARNRDGMPMRCPEDFENAYRQVAQQHSSVILVDSPRVLRDHSAHGLLDDHHFHDAQHPTLRSYVLLAQQALDQLQQRRALDWPEHVPAPHIDPASTAAHFGIDAEKWLVISERSMDFYKAIAYIRYDAQERLRKMAMYAEARENLLQGVPIEQIEVPGLGLSAAGWRDENDSGTDGERAGTLPVSLAPGR